MPTSDPARDLQAIAGRWLTSGHIVGDEPILITGTDTYDVLAGGHFLVHHVDVHVGDQPVVAIEIIGEPNPGGGYLARSYDNAGNAELMTLTIDDAGVFHFEGGGEVASAAQPGDAPTARVRATLTVAADGQSMHALWERSEDGSTWQLWMDMDFRLDTRA
ncbi:MAG TPA: hypothetical protein VFB94_22635 [Acidimicrobiales bacterium]|jgi:hypothetical protein|nr:hypothetical protein [Acidimicrobiales bacterium]